MAVQYWNFKIFRRVCQRMRSGYSPAMLITGGTNRGKTCLGALCAEVVTVRIRSGIYTKRMSEKEYYYHYNRIKWNPETNVFFDMNNLSHRLLDARKEVILIAEAGYDLSFDEWMSKYNKFFDKILMTQRIMGNLYILNVPIAKDLARRQRRKIDFLLDVKYWGLAKAWEMKTKTREMVGNEFGSMYWGEIAGYPVPMCNKRLKELDEDNKNRIRKDLIEEIREDEIKTLEKIKIKKTKYKCPHCGYTWHPKVDKPKKCPSCQGRLFVKGGNLDVEKIKE